MKRHVLTMIIILCAASCSFSATWHVAKDGSGDFTVIQDAIDAASPGDVIWVHAGRYDDLIVDHDVWGNNTVIADVHVAITKDNLTLQGDGEGSTIIGPEQYPDDPTPNYIGVVVTSNDASSLIVRNLAVENVRYGMYVASPACEITSCRFEGNHVEGMRLFTSSSCLVEDCDFVDSGYGVKSFSPTSNLSVLNSRFSGGVAGCRCVASDNVVISNCIFEGGLGAIDFQQGTTGIVNGVDAFGFEVAGISLSLGGAAEVYDSRFEGGLFGVYSSGESIHCERTSFINQTSRMIRVNNNGDSVFHDCEFINGGGWTVYCMYNGSDDCHLDMTNNYWGTDSEAQIAEWIYDSNDDPDYCCTVDFIPFNGSMSTEPQSWSAVKGLFSGGSEE